MQGEIIRVEIGDIDRRSCAQRGQEMDAVDKEEDEPYC